MTERRAYRVFGRVQGVGFRWWTRQVATGLELQGIVRNEPDGTVYLDVMGGAEGLDDLERQLRAGPRHSSVSEVRREEPGADPLPRTFEITG
jgi:acylphosphatase